MPHLLALPRRVAALLAVWLARWEQRRALEDMTDDQLRDLGLSRVQAGAEAARPFWSGRGDPADAHRPPRDRLSSMVARRPGGAGHR